MDSNISSDTGWHVLHNPADMYTKTQALKWPRLELISVAHVIILGLMEVLVGIYKNMINNGEQIFIRSIQCSQI